MKKWDQTLHKEQASSFLGDVLDRICLGLKMNSEKVHQIKSQTLCVSVDMAHALHPNYISIHEPRHQPLLSSGITIKMNAQQRYASDAESASIIYQLGKNLGLPIQKFVVRSDMGCGSTIGPITASRWGIKTVDIGCPQLAMHSTKELAACEDHENMCQLLTAVFENRPKVLD